MGVTARNVRRAQEHAETKDWWTHATSCALEHYGTRDEALGREAELIKRYAPPFNTVHNDKKNEAQNHYLRSAGPPKLSLFGSVMETESPFVSGDSCVSDDVLPEVAALFYGTPSRRLAKQRYYKMTTERKRVAPCVECAERPGANGPTCAKCKPNNPFSK